jgi:hypothetical protein
MLPQSGPVEGMISTTRTEPFRSARFARDCRADGLSEYGLVPLKLNPVGAVGRDSRSPSNVAAEALPVSLTLPDLVFVGFAKDFCQKPPGWLFSLSLGSFVCLLS